LYVAGLSAIGTYRFIRLAMISVPECNGVNHKHRAHSIIIPHATTPLITNELHGTPLACQLPRSLDCLYVNIYNTSEQHKLWQLGWSHSLWGLSEVPLTDRRVTNDAAIQIHGHIWIRIWYIHKICHTSRDKANNNGPCRSSFNHLGVDRFMSVELYNDHRCKSIDEQRAIFHYGRNISGR